MTFERSVTPQGVVAPSQFGFSFASLGIIGVTLIAVSAEFALGKGGAATVFFVLAIFSVFLSLALERGSGVESTETRRVRRPEKSGVKGTVHDGELVSLPGEGNRRSLKELLRPSNFLARKIAERTRVLTLAGSAFAALLLVLVVTFVYPTYQVRPRYDDLLVLVFILVLIPPSALDISSRAYLRQIDSRIPDFLRDIAESQRTGLPFTRALSESASTNYGALTKELKKAMAKMSLGFTFEDALDSFADSAETPIAHRAAVLLKEVGRSGGRMLEVLDLVYEHIREVITLQKERSKQLTPYIIVIYASFAVYIFVVFILFTTFFAQVRNLVNSGAPFGTNISPGVYYIWFLHLSAIEALFGGLVAGKISAGTASAGLKHVLVLLLISFVAFTFFIQV